MNTNPLFFIKQILLALLEACVLEKKNNDFVTTAMALPQLIQLEIMEMLRPMIINSQEIGNHLAEDFADILTKSSGLCDFINYVSFFDVLCFLEINTISTVKPV